MSGNKRKGLPKRYRLYDKCSKALETEMNRFVAGGDTDGGEQVERDPQPMDNRLELDSRYSSDSVQLALHI